MITLYVLRYNAGILGVYKSEEKAIKEKDDYKSYNYPCLKIEEFHVYE